MNSGINDNNFKVVPVDFNTRQRIGADGPSLVQDSSSSTEPRTAIQRFSQGNDPFGDLATRLTDFFSKPESENHQAQEIKKACWDSLEDDKKPVFKPVFENIKTAKFSKSPEGLTITLSPSHVDQSYLQVLSDLTLVAEMIKKSISKESEHSIRFTSNPIEKIKIISHPERNLVIPVTQINQNLDYQIGPEFKLIESKKGLIIPVVSGMFNLDDVQASKLRTPSSNNSHLEDFAFNALSENPLQEMYDLRTAYLTASNKIFLTPLDIKTRGTRLVMEGFGYDGPNQELESIVGQHNSGRIYNQDISIPLKSDIRTTSLDPSYTEAVRKISDYEIETPNKILHGSPEALSHRQVERLTAIDALKLFNRSIAVVAPSNTWILPGYAMDHADREAITKIVK
jgi:hypothetical protein